jgi:nucleoid-associated protein Lsr2
MAQKVQVVLVDDIDGGSADETVSFALDGVGYEIDLTTANAARLREVLAPYVGHARKASRGSAGRRSPRAGKSAGNSAEIRAWAKAQGLEINERGRIPAGIVARYEAAR